MNPRNFGTPSTSATFKGFKPYTGTNVNPMEFCQVEISNRTVWARIDKIAGSQKTTGEEYVVSILGHGDQPAILFSSLTNECREKLKKHREDSIRN